MLTMQGAAAALAGTIAQLTTPAWSMTTMATISTAVTLTLAAAGRRTPSRTTEPAQRARGDHGSDLEPDTAV